VAPKQKSRIGILGGSFDPVHGGHCALAHMALEHFALDTVFFIPACIPPHKTDSVSASAAHRLAMLKAAVRGNRAFQVWDGEVRRKGVSFTVDTLQQFRKRYPSAEFHFIIGSDNIRQIRTWREYETILGMVTLCITRRPGWSLRIPPELSMARIAFFPSPMWGVSSTLIRKYLAENLSCRYLVPSAVLEYIRAHRLYRQ